MDRHAQLLTTAPGQGGGRGRCDDRWPLPRLALTLGATGLAGLAVLAVGGPTAVVLATLTGKLAYSTSDGAARFLFGWLLLCGLAVAAWPARPSLVVAGFGALLVGHLLGLVLTLDYFTAHGLPWAAHAHHWKDGGNSFTALLHSHLAKPAIALLLGQPPAAAGRYDMGYPFVPAGGWRQGLLGAVAVCFLLAGIGLAAGAGWLRQRHPQAPGLAWAWVLAGGAALKAMLDGGLLSERVPMSLAVLAALLVARRAAWPLCVAAALEVGARVLEAGPHGWPGLGSLLFTLTLYGGLLSLHQRVPRWAAFVAVGYLLAGLAGEAELNLGPLLRPLPAGTRVWRIDPAALDAEPLTVPAGRSAWEVYRQAGEDPRKPQRIWIARPQAAGGASAPAAAGRAWLAVLPLELARSQGRLDAGDRVIARLRSPTVGAPIAAAASSPARLLLELGPGSAAGAAAGLPPVWPAATGDLLDRHNYWVYLHLAALRLERAGLREFLLVPIRGPWPAACCTPLRNP